MIRVPSGIACDVDRLQLANKALVFSSPRSQPISFGCRNRNLNLLLIVAAQRSVHHKHAGRESVELFNALMSLID